VDNVLRFSLLHNIFGKAQMDPRLAFMRFSTLWFEKRVKAGTCYSKLAAENAERIL